MATPALANQVRLERGTSDDLDEVIEIMEAAFGSKYGEAWTRSQCAGSRHRQGIGTRLLDEFMDRSRSAGAGRVHLEVRDGNPAAAMYRAAGFSPVGRRRTEAQGQDGQRYAARPVARTL